VRRFGVDLAKVDLVKAASSGSVQAQMTTHRAREVTGPVGI
jgi:hypothetical protein